MHTADCSAKGCASARLTRTPVGMPRLVRVGVGVRARVRGRARAGVAIRVRVRVRVGVRVRVRVSMPRLGMTRET